MLSVNLVPLRIFWVVNKKIILFGKNQIHLLDILLLQQNFNKPFGFIQVQEKINSQKMANIFIH